eukprot:1156602-Pelagomonas_calceolata.AAC.2
MGGPHAGASHRTHATLHVLEGPTDDIILGKDWFEQEDPQVKWRENAAIFAGGLKVKERLAQR